MSIPKIITVIGATGQQGGGLVRAILRDPERRFAVRAVTRDPHSERARALARIGAELLLETLDGLAGGRLQPQPQDHALATLAPILDKQDGRVDWTRPASEIGWRVRGFQPWPGMTAAWQGQGLKLVRVAEAEPGPGTPGEILEIGPSGVLVGCGGGTRLRLAEVQPESRRSMPAAAWAAGARLQPGARLA
jgi:methionyl-tRNA formyltransferase